MRRTCTRASARWSSSRWAAAGRRSPRSPTIRPDLDQLLELSRGGRHAASDYLETAALAGVTTVGCNRCGGGLAGAVAVSNVREGARIAAELAPDLVLFDGSGAAIPPVETSRRILVVNSASDPEVATGYLNEYRHLVSDLVILTMAEPGTGWEELHRRALALAPAVVATTLRPRPTADIAGRKVAFFSAAPESAHAIFAAHLAEEYGADIVHVSGALADRETLRSELEDVDAEVFLVELKAAAIDVVAEAASERGVEVVLAGSDVRAVDGEDLDAELLRLAVGGSRMSERRKGERNVLGSAESPYSKGLMARALTAVGLREDEAYELARRTESDLAQRGEVSVDLDRLQELASDFLGADRGPRAVRQLRRFRDLQELDLPVILLVGGGTGTGKSTVATEVAYRLGITRVTSTDFVRQTMRAFFAKEFMPSIHYSSFEAGLGLTKAEEEESGDAALLGFLDQTRNVLTGVEAALQRALDEGWSMVLEGVHLVPGMITTELKGALVVQCVLAIHNEEIHKTHFWIRDAHSDGVRPVDRYIAGMPEIRMIQEYVLERAARNDVPVIENESQNDAIGAVMNLVLEQAERAARGVPR